MPVGWHPGAFKLAACDRWIGWSAEQQFRRLHLVANNSRFVILGPRGEPNLASPVPGLSSRRLSANIQAAHGYPALLAETFVDVSRFAGNCSRASNQRSPGLTCGSAAWRACVTTASPRRSSYKFTDGAAEALSRNETPQSWNVEQHDSAGPMVASGLRSLFPFPGEMLSAAAPRASAENRSGNRVHPFRRPAYPGTVRSD